MADTQTTATQDNAQAPEEHIPGSEPLSEDIKLIVAGVFQIVVLVVPLLLIHTLRKRIEEGKTFKTIEKHLQV